MKATIEERGISVSAEIASYEDDEDYVLISITIVPAPPGLDALAYQRTQKVPDARR